MTARNGVPTVQVEVHEGLLTDALVQAWDQLAASTGAPPWARPGWFLPWWTAFSRGRPVVLTLVRGSELVAVLPLQRTHDAWRSPTNWHTPEYVVVAASERLRRQVLHEALSRFGSRLTPDFVDDRLAEELAEVARRRAGASYRRVLEASPYLLLHEGWERSLRRHTLTEVQRRARHLQERGELTLDVRDGGEHLASLLDEGYGVEASGWRIQQGTAIASSPATTAFHTDVASWPAGLGLLRLSYLRLGVRALAFDLALEHAGVHFLLKTGHLESERAGGPGKLLRLRVLQHCAAKGVQAFEFLGDAAPWKDEWTTLTQQRCQAHGFPSGLHGTRGRLVHAGLLPAARRGRDAVHVLRTAVSARRPG